MKNKNEKKKNLKSRTSLDFQFRQRAIPVQMFSQRVSLFIFLILIDGIIGYDTSVLEYEMEKMAKLIERKQPVRPEHNMQINYEFVRSYWASLCMIFNYVKHSYF